MEASRTLMSVNVSLPKSVEYEGEVVWTGIFKEPVPGRVAVRRLNLDGDGQADLSVHGGIDKAVYAYPVEHYDHWRRALGSDLPFGQFGENFTVSRMLEEETSIGDVYRVGTAVVQVTQPRTPCFKLGIRMGDRRFLKRFLASGRTGFYLRVLEEGEVGAGDVIELVHADPGRLTVAEVLRIAYDDPDDSDGAKRAVAVQALSEGWRDWFRA
ncbi:MAG TPA: MOSC domain-containing protein [Gemmatimonadota bacterium]|nr:MOSC domain-containing protein [Gemmatimonadota bacterium]